MRKIIALFMACLFFPLISQAALQKDNDSFLVFSDIHLNPQSVHSMEVSPSSGGSDLDLSTFETFLSQIKQNMDTGVIHHPKFIMILGDIVGHKRSDANTNYALNAEAAVLNLVKSTFPDIPVFYTFGNNDSLQGDYGPFKYSSEALNGVTSPFDIAEINGWNNGFLSTGTMCIHRKETFPCLISQSIANGYYSAYVSRGLRLISLNTVQFSPRRSGVSSDDAQQQLDWVKSELASAKRNNEQVIFTMHIPPGKNVFDDSSFWLGDEQAKFLQLVNEYHGIIIGLVAGHTHLEELKIIQNKSNEKVAGVYLVAGLSTSHGNEPSVKTFYIEKDKERWSLADYETFHFSAINAPITFSSLYHYDSYYCSAHQSGLYDCLGSVTADKMQKYYTAGNVNNSAAIQYPDDIRLVVP